MLVETNIPKGWRPKSGEQPRKAKFDEHYLLSAGEVRRWKGWCELESGDKYIILERDE